MIFAFMIIIIYACVLTIRLLLLIVDILIIFMIHETQTWDLERLSLRLGFISSCSLSLFANAITSTSSVSIVIIIDTFSCSLLTSEWTFVLLLDTYSSNLNAISSVLYNLHRAYCTANQFYFFIRCIFQLAAIMSFYSLIFYHLMEEGLQPKYKMAREGENLI